MLSLIFTLFLSGGWVVEAETFNIAGGVDGCADWAITLNDGQFGVRIKPPGADCTGAILSGVAVTPGTFSHVVGTNDGTTARIYVDGVERNSGPVNPNYVATNTFRIGTLTCCGGAYPGVVDEVTVYNRALTSAEILAIFNAGSAGKCKPAPVGGCVPPPSGVIAWYPGDGNANDISGNNRHGTLQNGAGFAPAKVLQGFSLDGIDDFVSAPNFNPGSQWTVEAWVTTPVDPSITEGVFLSRGGTLSNIALSGLTVPGVGTLSRDFDGPTFNNNSTVAFANRGITGGSATGAVFLKKIGGPLTVIAKTGDAAPVPGGAVFANVARSFDDVTLNNHDDMAFIAAYTDDGGTTFKLGIFLKPDGQPLEAVVLYGDALPGTGGGTVCARPDNVFGLDGPWMNDSQVVLFKTDAICGSKGTFGESAFAKRHAMPIEQALLIGETAPPSVGGTIASIEFGHPAINNANTFAFHIANSTTPEVEAILTRTLGSSATQVCVQTGAAAPRTSGILSSLSAPAINQSGLMQFHADVSGDPNIFSGVFSCQNGTVNAIALQGDPMPVIPPANFGNAVEEGSVSDDERFVFLNENNFGANTPEGVIATGPTGTPLIAIAIEGQPAPGTAGVFGKGCSGGFFCGANMAVFDEPFVNASGDSDFIGIVIPGPTPTPTPSPGAAAQPINLSTRMRVETGDNVGIGGFIIRGSAPKRVIIRAIGPDLMRFGLTGLLADPVLELHGTGGFTTIINDNWRDTQEAEIAATGLPPVNNSESAIVVTLLPGPYTAIVRGKNGTSGLALVEVYDLDPSAASRLANLSTRAKVNTGDNLVIAGFILGHGSGDDSVVIRGLGPSLTSAGVANVLANPALQLRDHNGNLVLANNNWQDDPAQAMAISGAGLAPSNTLEAAIFATLSPGAYTALLTGESGGIGVGLVEIYQIGMAR